MSGSNEHWKLASEARLHGGYAYGCQYPSIIMPIIGPTLAAKRRRAICQDLAQLLGWHDVPEIGDGDGWQDTLDWLLRLVDHMQRACHMPVYENARTLQAAPAQARIQIPACRRSLLPLGKLVIEILSAMTPAAFGNETPDKLQKIAAAYKALAVTAMQGSNVPRFMRAAYDLGMPFRELPGQYMLYGMGRRAARMNSSFTQHTSHMAAKIARDKAICAATLRLAGIPVPPHQLVNDPQKAIEIAEKIGFPVVVKPADRDGGQAVSAGLDNAEQVAAAFELAKRVSARVLVEKHVSGRDYRLTVHRGELIWAVERVPAGVKGNGRHTIEQLVATANTDPLRSRSAHSPLKPIELDAEADRLLTQRGLTRQYIAPDGLYIPLRRAANVNSGGVPLGVFDDVHPDNARLAIRAAQALQLDLAGIDILIPNIAQSWKETGAAICEVNGQPQLGGTTGKHLYSLVLQTEVTGNGRIPTLLLWGDLPADDPLRKVESDLTAQGLIVGWHDAQGVRIGGEAISNGPVGTFEAGEMIAGDPDVDIMVLTITDTKALETGLAVPNVDLIVDAGGVITAHGSAQTTPLSTLITAMIQIIAPACDGTIMTPSEQAASLWQPHTKAAVIGKCERPAITQWLLQRHHAHGRR